MDILRPQLVWVGNRCYRKNLQKESSNFNPEEEELWDAGQPDNMIYCDEICDAGLDIEETSRGFKLKMPIPNVFFKYIIGKKGETKKRLETETRVQIFVPRPGDKEEITISGSDKKGVISAKTRIDVLVDSARQRQPFTHFLSIPLTTDNIITGFENFKDDVLLHCDGDQGVEASIFQNPNKLHLTITTLVLLNDAEIERATSLLESCKEDFLGPLMKGDKGLTIQLEGLEYMNDDPHAVDVLYAKVKPGETADRLQMMVDRLMDRFTYAGLAQKEYDRVKLHATVMNTLFRKSPADADSGRDPGRAPREAFDASRVLKKFRDYEFGSLTIPSVHLSQRFSSGPDQYYQCVGQLVLDHKQFG